MENLVDCYLLRWSSCVLLLVYCYVLRRFPFRLLLLVGCCLGDCCYCLVVVDVRCCCLRWQLGWLLPNTMIFRSLIVVDCYVLRRCHGWMYRLVGCRLVVLVVSVVWFVASCRCFDVRLIATVRYRRLVCFFLSMFRCSVDCYRSISTFGSLLCVDFSMFGWLLPFDIDVWYCLWRCFDFGWLLPFVIDVALWRCFGVWLIATDSISTFDDGMLYFLFLLYCLLQCWVDCFFIFVQVSLRTISGVPLQRAELLALFTVYCDSVFPYSRIIIFLS
jgi:hypothetical protein